MRPRAPLKGWGAAAGAPLAAIAEMVAGFRAVRRVGTYGFKGGDAWFQGWGRMVPRVGTGLIEVGTGAGTEGLFRFERLMKANPRVCLSFYVVLGRVTVGRIRILYDKMNSRAPKMGARLPALRGTAPQARQDRRVQMVRRINYRVGPKRGQVRVNELAKFIPEENASAFVRDCIRVWVETDAGRLRLPEMLAEWIEMRSEIQAIGRNFNQFLHIVHRMELRSGEKPSPHEMEYTRKEITEAVEALRGLIRFWKVG